MRKAPRGLFAEACLRPRAWVQAHWQMPMHLTENRWSIQSRSPSFSLGLKFHMLWQLQKVLRHRPGRR